MLDRKVIGVLCFRLIRVTTRRLKRQICYRSVASFCRRNKVAGRNSGFID